MQHNYLLSCFVDRISKQHLSCLILLKANMANAGIQDFSRIRPLTVTSTNVIILFHKTLVVVIIVSSLINVAMKKKSQLCLFLINQLLVAFMSLNLGKI